MQGQYRAAARAQQGTVLYSNELCLFATTLRHGICLSLGLCFDIRCTGCIKYAARVCVCVCKGIHVRDTLGCPARAVRPHPLRRPRHHILFQCDRRSYLEKTYKIRGEAGAPQGSTRTDVEEVREYTPRREGPKNTVHKLHGSPDSPVQTHR